MESDFHLEKRALVQRAAVFMAQNGYTNSDGFRTCLAQFCNMPSNMLAYLYDKPHELLIDVVGYVTQVSYDQLFDTKQPDCAISGLRHFAKRVLALIHNHPECIAPFRAYFAIEAVCIPAYDNLVMYLSCWRNAVFNQLKAILPNEWAKRIAAVYMSRLKNGLRDYPHGPYGSQIKQANRFLLSVIDLPHLMS